MLNFGGVLYIMLIISIQRLASVEMLGETHYIPAKNKQAFLASQLNVELAMFIRMHLCQMSWGA